MSHNTLYAGIFAIVLGLSLAQPLPEEPTTQEPEPQDAPMSFLPDFLHNLTTDDRKEYFGVITNYNSSRKEVRANVLAWAATKGIQNEVEAYETKLKAVGEERKANISQAISELPSAFEKLIAVENDDNLSASETLSEILKMIQDSSPYLRELLMSITRIPPTFNNSAPPNGAPADNNNNAVEPNK